MLCFFSSVQFISPHLDGISGGASIVLQISSTFETFGSFVPNAVTRRISLKAALIGRLFHGSVENTQPGSLLSAEICIYIPDLLLLRH